MHPFVPIAAFFALSTSFTAMAIADEPAPTKPAGLKPGDAIAIIAPAGPLDKDRVELATKRLNEMGFRVMLSKDLYRKRGYLAGGDRRRAEEFTAAFANPEIKAVFPGTGGYGATRMLDLVDWDIVRANPKILIGFSDVTALHLAMASQCRIVTFHSPNPMWGLGSPEGMSPFSSRWFWRSIRADAQSTPAGYTIDEPSERNGYPADDEAPLAGPLTAIAPGVGRGRMIGGNLSLVASLCGTRYAPSMDGRILFLEDVNEAPYRVDRMLSQLRMAGMLRSPAGVILGQFTKSKPDEGDEGITLDDVFDDYFSNAPYPVVKHFAAGHVRQNATLPFGVLAELNANRPELRILENPVQR